MALAALLANNLLAPRPVNSGGAGGGGGPIGRVYVPSRSPVVRPEVCSRAVSKRYQVTTSVTGRASASVSATYQVVARATGRVVDPAGEEALLLLAAAHFLWDES